MITKRLYFLQILLLCVPSLCAGNNQQITFGSALSSAFKKSASRIKDSVINLIEENPVTCLAVITGVSVCGAYYGIRYAREYFSIARDPIPILIQGRVRKNHDTFNKALRVLNSQESFNTAIEYSWESRQRDLIFDRYHHRFDFSTAMHFFQSQNDEGLYVQRFQRIHTPQANLPTYIERLNLANPNLLNPGAVFEWCITNTEYNSRYNYYNILYFFLQRQESFSEHIKEEILNPCLESACANGNIQAIDYLLSIGAEFIPEESRIDKVLSGCKFSADVDNALLFLVNHQNVPPQKKEALVTCILSSAGKYKKVSLAQRILQ